MKKNLLAFFTIIVSSVLSAQNVNEFTGDFTYSTPLISVPCPYGPAVNISASYGSGIGVNQSASEIGLGWGINAGGVISRNVSGIPDDWNGKVVSDPQLGGFKKQGGVMAFTNSQPNDNLDFYKSTYKIDTPFFCFPNYDYYSVSGPGLVGSLQPKLFDFATTELNVQNSTINDPPPPIPYVIDITQPFTSTLRFNFGGDYGGDFKSRHYPSTPIDINTTLRLPGTKVSDAESSYLADSLPYVGIGNIGFNPTTNRLATAKYVEYTTDANGITGFTITDEAGYVYSYTIPVYINYSVFGNYPLKNDYTLKTLDTTRYTDANGNYYINENNLDSPNNPYMVEWKQNASYAYNWLLKSVKGLDYVDSNSNGVVDIGDGGYWVSYDWQLWTNNFNRRTPEYGFDYSFSGDENEKTREELTTTSTKIIGKFGTFSLYNQEIYYLNKIQTSSHTAIFVRDVRNDAMASKNYISGNVIPQLKLNRIILFKNEDFSTLNLPSSSSAYYVSTSVSGFSVTSAGKDKFYNETWYNHVNNKNAIESKSLQSIEFNQDYSLARKYANNIKTVVTGTTKFSSPSDVIAGTSVGSDYSISGKLTLNEIVTYNVKRVKTAPSVIFDYNKDISNDNPDFNPIKIDYWGYYKSDATSVGFSSYTNAVSKDYTDAWSLRKITTQLGGTMEINYESNQYGRVFNGNGGFRGPSKMYSIASLSTPVDNGTNVNWNFVMEEGGATITDFDALKNSPPAGTIKHVFLPYVDGINGIKYISHGTFSFSSNTLTAISNMFLATPFSSNEYVTASSADSDESKLGYTGNGYIHFQLPLDTVVYGGGIRVKTIVTKNGANDSYTQDYAYYDGTTPMEADRFSEEKLIGEPGHLYYQRLSPAAYDKHRMGPGVGYGKVVLKSIGQNGLSNGSTIYNFITSDFGIDNFKANVEQRIFNNVNHPENGWSVCTSTDLSDTAYIVEVIDKFSGFWGQVSQVQNLDFNNNILTKTINEYANLNQGSIVENYDFFRKKKHTSYMGQESATCSEHHHIVCILRNYPVVLTKQTQYVQDMSSTTEYLAFDKITRVPTIVRNTTPNKGISVTRTSPAFRISQYSTMGPKSVLSTNANVLSPVAYEKSTVDSTISSTSDFIDYSISTYKKDFYKRKFDATANLFVNDLQTNQFWVQDRSYAWVGSTVGLDSFGLYRQSELAAAPFDYTLSSIDSKWRFNSENTLFDNSGHLLEVKGFNNRFSAKKFGYGDTLQIAEASNVNYASFTYSGFEGAVRDFDSGAGVKNYLDGEVKLANGVRVFSTTNFPSHTGNYLLKVPSGTTGVNSPSYSVKYNSVSEYTGLLKGRTYRVSVWVHSSSPSSCQIVASFPGVTSVTVSKSNSANIIAGNWTQINLDITIPNSPTNGDELKIQLESSSGDAYFDDFKFYPVDAIVTSTVYEPRTNRVLATLDANNFATIYKYDAGGKVLEIWQEFENIGIKRVKKYQYNFARGVN